MICYDFFYLYTFYRAGMSQWWESRRNMGDQSRHTFVNSLFWGITRESCHAGILFLFDILSWKDFHPKNVYKSFNNKYHWKESDWLMHITLERIKRLTSNAKQGNIIIILGQFWRRVISVNLKSWTIININSRLSQQWFFTCFILFIEGGVLKGCWKQGD